MAHFNAKPLATPRRAAARRPTRRARFRLGKWRKTSPAATPAAAPQNQGAHFPSVSGRAKVPAEARYPVNVATSARWATGSIFSSAVRDAATVGSRRSSSSRLIVDTALLMPLDVKSGPSQGFRHHTGVDVAL